jgi:hypothetical protein
MSTGFGFIGMGLAPDEFVGLDARNTMMALVGEYADAVAANRVRPAAVTAAPSVTTKKEHL